MTARIAPRLSAKRVMSRRFYSVAEVWRTLMKDLFDPYRPELHYMRGPGPKWRERHARAYAVAGYSNGELARAAA